MEILSPPLSSLTEDTIEVRSPFEAHPRGEPTIVAVTHTRNYSQLLPLVQDSRTPSFCLPSKLNSVFAMEPEHVYTISEINSTARQVIENGIGSVWLRGEISNLKRAPSGHTYFTLKDNNAEIAAVRFRSLSPLLPSQTLASGMEVIAYGRVTLYEPRGQYQFVVSLVQPAGLGKLQLSFERLKQRLQQEGLFDETHKLPIPRYPLQIGVVTSPTGAAIRDIISVAARRWPLAQLYLFPSAVQGEAAPMEIASAIVCADEFSASNSHLDLLIVGRGGGSLEDLSVFNDERVARAIYACQIPIVSAIGHEIDFTISDFVSDRRAPTPSAAAEIVLPDQDDLRRELQGTIVQILRRVRARIDRADEKMHLSMRGYVFRIPSRKIESLAQRFDLLIQLILRAIQRAFINRTQELKRLQGLLELSDPDLPLRRGYSITRIAGEERVLHDAADTAPGTAVETRLSRGSILSRVEEVKNNEDR